MRAIVQRVSEACVRVDGKEVGAIDRGILVLLGVELRDGMDDVQWLAGKVRPPDPG